jgi:hypothetical protein
VKTVRLAYVNSQEVKGTGAGLTAAALIAMVRQADPCLGMMNTCCKASLQHLGCVLILP